MRLTNLMVADLTIWRPMHSKTEIFFNHLLTHLASDPRTLNNRRLIRVPPYSPTHTAMRFCASLLALGSLLHCLQAMGQPPCAPVPTYSCTSQPLFVVDPNPGGTVNMDIVLDFYADPSGTNSSHEAFVAAANFFNLRQGNGTLFIPAGEYIVGKQCPTTYYYLHGESPLSFARCADLTIIGEQINGVPASIIRFVDCLQYGAFTPTGDRLLQSCAYTCNPTDFSMRADIGAMIFLDDCSEVTIQDLELDGNLDNISIGGHFGSGGGMQIEYDGVFLLNSGGIAVNNTEIHHFGRDGIQVYGQDFSQVEACWPGTQYDVSMDIALTDTRCEWNGRTGMALVGGNGVSATDCAFNFTGMGRILSPTGSGVDIEYEVGSGLANCTFTNCEFIHNKYTGLECGEYGDPTVHDFTFTGCTFAASDSGYAMRPILRAMTFTNCKIHGEVLKAYDVPSGEPASNGTRFVACGFFDTFQGLGVSLQGEFMINAWEASGLFVEGCKFTSGCVCSLASGCHMQGLYISYASATPAFPAQVSNCQWEYTSLAYDIRKPMNIHSLK